MLVVVFMLNQRILCTLIDRLLELLESYWLYDHMDDMFLYPQFGTSAIER